MEIHDGRDFYAVLVKNVRGYVKKIWEEERMLTYCAGIDGKMLNGKNVY